MLRIWKQQEMAKRLYINAGTRVLIGALARQHRQHFSNWLSETSTLKRMYAELHSKAIWDETK